MARLGRSFPIRPHLQTAVLPSSIVFDAANNSGDQAAASSYSGSASWSGQNRMLAVDVSMLGPGVTVTAMTYGGAACTLIGVKSTVTSFGRVECWRILSSDAGAPAEGSNTLSVTLSGSLEFSVEWTSYKGVHQYTPTEAFNSAQATNAGSATDASVVITSTVDNCWMHGAVVANDTSITAGNTSRNNIAGTLGSGANEDNNGPKTPAGAVTLSYSGMGITTTWAIAGYAIRPLAAPTLYVLSMTATDATDTMSGTAAVAVAMSGAFADATDTMSGNAVVVSYTMTGAFTDGTDTMSGTAQVKVNASGAFTDGTDTMSGAAKVAIAASGAFTDATDTMSGTAKVAIALSGAFTDGTDTMSGAAQELVTVNAAMTDGTDTMSGTAAVAIALSGAFTDADDAMSGQMLISGGVAPVVSSSPILYGGRSTHRTAITYELPEAARMDWEDIRTKRRHALQEIVENKLGKAKLLPVLMEERLPEDTVREPLFDAMDDIIKIRDNRLRILLLSQFV